MAPSSLHPIRWSATHVHVPLITVINGQSKEAPAETEFGSFWNVTETENEKRPLVVHESRKTDHTLINSKVEIRSDLRSVVRHIMSGYLHLNLDTDPLVFKAPFKELVYRADAIFAYTPGNSAENDALAKLKYFLSIELKDDLQTFRNARQQDYHTFNDLWTAFVPGELVIHRCLNFVRCFQIVGSFFDEGEDEWVIEHRCWDFDTNSFGFSLGHTKIDRFHRAQHSSQLPLVPVRSLPREEWLSIREACIQRGQRWFRLQLGYKHHHYNAIAQHIKEIYEEPKEESRQFYVCGRVVVDPQASFKYADRSRAQLRDTERVSKEESFLKSQKLTEEQALLAPSRIGGMFLDEDTWYGFWIDELKEVEWVPGMWDRLDLDPTRKETIRTLVQGYDTSKYEPFEKNRGLVFFLNGPPGTGKTLTVESLAELKQRPLYKVSPSQWKDSAVLYRSPDPERRFRETFSLAQNWNAILLIDEADSIITKDASKTPTLQALLRQVERFRGIAFLTSNMVDRSIDDAVRSRLTTTLEYCHPSLTQACQAWKSLLEHRSIVQNQASEAAEHLSKTWDLDYRQMNSAFLLADALANARKTRITPKLMDEALKFKGEMPRKAIEGDQVEGEAREGN